jgi:hypothetical protein
MGSNKESKRQVEGSPGLAHRAVRCATGQCPVHQGTSSSTLHLREFSEALHYNSPDCPVYHRTVSSAPGRSDSELASFGNPLRYNSPDCPVQHRTVRCASGAMATPRATVDCNALNARLRAQRTEHAWVAHRTVYRTCPVHHRTARRAHKSELQRSELNGRLTWLAHWTVSGAPCDSSLHQRSSLVVGAINTPTTPTFKPSKFLHFYTLQEL